VNQPEKVQITVTNQARTLYRYVLKTTYSTVHAGLKGRLVGGSASTPFPNFILNGIKPL
jgi:hypothetical protein